MTAAMSAVLEQSVLHDSRESLCHAARQLTCLAVSLMSRACRPVMLLQQNTEYVVSAG